MEYVVTQAEDHDRDAVAATVADVARTTRYARRAAAVCLAAVLPLGVVAVDIATPKVALASATDAAISAAGLLKGRSPGARSSQLLLTKAKRSLTAADGVGRRSRMLPTGDGAGPGASRAIPREVTPGLTQESTNSLLSPLEAVIPDGAPAGGSGSNAGPAAVGPASAPGFNTPNIITPSVVDPLATPTATPTVVPTNPASALPEPSTWMSMIFGFGLAGMMLRRRKVQPRLV